MPLLIFQLCIKKEPRNNLNNFHLPLIEDAIQRLSTYSYRQHGFEELAGSLVIELVELVPQIIYFVYLNTQQQQNLRSNFSHQNCIDHQTCLLIESLEFGIFLKESFSLISGATATAKLNQRQITIHFCVCCLFSILQLFDSFAALVSLYFFCSSHHNLTNYCLPNILFCSHPNGHTQYSVLIMYFCSHPQPPFQYNNMMPSLIKNVM